MAKPKHIELPDETIIPILYEDRVVLALDKPAGWLLAPDSWDRTSRNLQLAIDSSLNNGDYWAQSRNLDYLRFVHRLDADTSGVMLFAKSPGALTALSALFETRRVEKTYLAVVRGQPREKEWTCSLPIGPYPGTIGVMRVDEREGQDAETHFRVLQSGPERSLIEVRPQTGRTHQIRVHLVAAGHPVLGDVLYGPERIQERKGFARMALRAVKLAYPDPFQKRMVFATAPREEFLKEFGMEPPPGAKPASRAAGS